MTRARQPRPPAAPLGDLPERYWSHLRDVRWAGRPARPVGHVLVGPSGIYVVRHVPAGNWSGTADAQGHRLPADVVTTSAAEAGVVRDMLPSRYGDRVRPVVCLLGAGDLAEDVDGVLVAALDTFEHILVASRPVLSTSEVRAVSSALRVDLERVVPAPSDAPRRVRVVRRAAAATLAVAAALTAVLVADPGILDALRGRG